MFFEEIIKEHLQLPSVPNPTTILVQLMKNGAPAKPLIIFLFCSQKLLDELIILQLSQNRRGYSV